MSQPLHVCPLCYTNLAPPGMRADGYPLVLPRREDITAVAVTVSDEHITVLFASGLTASRPISYSARLAAASPTERAQGQVIGSQHLRWERIDEDLDAIAFLGFPEDLGLAVIEAIEADEGGVKLEA